MNPCRAAVVAGLLAISVIGTGLASATARVDRTKAVRNAIEGGRAKNVILLIGDGMGDSRSPSPATTRSGPGASSTSTNSR